jgi:hypothetical protein
MDKKRKERSPEVEKALAEFHKNIGKSLVNNLNRQTKDKPEPKKK